jgi:hypothetical protein
MLRPAVIALMLAACLAAQEPPPPAAPDAPAGAPPPAAQAPAAQTPPPTASPSAAAEEAARAGEAALDLAARFQRGEVARAAPTSLHGIFGVRAADAQGNLVRAQIERWYTRSPERLVTRRKEELTGLASTVGSSDGVVWFRDDRSGKVISYTDDPETFDADLELQQEQLRLTSLLLDACVLDALRPRLAQVRAAGKDVVIDGDGVPHPVTLVDASAPDQIFLPPPGAPPPRPGDAPPQLQLRFGIGTEDGALWSLRVQATRRPDLAPTRLVFDLHASTRDGLRVPANIKLFRGDEAQPAVSLWIEEDEERHLAFEVDAPIDAALFARPEPPGG